MMTVDSIPCAKRHYVIEPIYSRQNRLFAMELLTRFNDEGPCSEKRIQQMSRADKQALLVDQLESIARKRRYFIENDLLLSINIDFIMGIFLSQNRDAMKLMDKLPFICLEISESFPNINDGKRNPLLATLYDRYPLWLDNFGSGNSNSYAVSQSTFQYIKFDKIFYWEMIKNRSVDKLTILIEKIKRYCHGIIIEGVQTHSEYYLLRNCSIEGIQGYIYPTYTLDTLPTLKK